VYTFASSVGPSGWNGDYILNLDKALMSLEQKYKPSIPDLPGDPATKLLSTRLRSFLLEAKEKSTGVLFAYGVGNNDHEQCGIKNPSSTSPPTRPFDEDNRDQITRGLWELAILLHGYIPPPQPSHPQSTSAVPRIQPLSVHCGGAHSVVITKSKQCFAFGR